MDELVVRAGRLEKPAYFDRVGKGALSLVGQERCGHDLKRYCAFILTTDLEVVMVGEGLGVALEASQSLRRQR